MIQTIVLLSVAVVASVQCDLKDFTDKDAFFLAQKSNGSLLEPPKALYDQIVKELAAVRKSFPEVADVRHHPVLVPGKMVCFNLDYQKINESKEFGPIRVEGVGQKVMNHDQVMITFTKPFNTGGPLEEALKQFGGKPNADGSNEFGCSSVNHWGGQSMIVRGRIADDLPFTYVFQVGHCFEPVVFECPDAKSWRFNVSTDAKTGDIKVRRVDEPHKSSTARINLN